MVVIFINGSINSGKSTVAKILAKKIGNAALLEIDELRNFISWMPLEKSIPINLQNACSLISNFVKNKIHVVVPYPLSQQNYQFVLRQLKDIRNELHFLP